MGFTIYCLSLVICSSTLLTTALTVFRPMGSDWSISCPDKSVFDPDLSFKQLGSYDETVLFIGAAARPSVRKYDITASHYGDNFVYSFSNLHYRYAGEYRCSPPGNTTRLTVVYRQLDCSIKSSVVREGDAILASCSMVLKGDDAPKISWRMGNETVESVTNKGDDEVIAVPKLNATASLNSDILTCSVEDLPFPIPCHVRVNVHYLPKSVTVYPKTQKNIKGSKAQIFCNADANPKAKYDFSIRQDTGPWMTVQQARTLIPGINVTGNHLTIPVFNNYEIRCEAFNQLGSRAAYADIELARPNITGPPTQSPSVGYAGKSLTLSCPVEPQNTNVTWYKDSVKDSNKVGVGKRIEITATRTDHGALYICRTTAFDVEASLRLKVQFPIGIDSNKTTFVKTIVFSANPMPQIEVRVLNGGIANVTMDHPTEYTTHIKFVVKPENLPIEYEIDVIERVWTGHGVINYENLSKMDVHEVHKYPTEKKINLK